MKYTTIHYQLLRELDISATEYILLDIVNRLSKDDRWCRLSKGSFALDLNTSERNVYKIIARVLDKKLISKGRNGNLKTTNKFKNTLNKVHDYPEQSSYNNKNNKSNNKNKEKDNPLFLSFENKIYEFLSKKRAYISNETDRIFLKSLFQNLIKISEKDPIVVFSKLYNSMNDFHASNFTIKYFDKNINAIYSACQVQYKNEKKRRTPLRRQGNTQSDWEKNEAKKQRNKLLREIEEKKRNGHEQSS